MNDRSGRTLLDAAVILFCLAGTGGSLNLFRIDLFQTMKTQMDPVGTITFKYNTAQRRLADRALWDRLRNESPVYDGDLIRTAEMSEATIRIPGSGEIKLGENTLIRILMINGKNEIDLASGSLAAGASGGALVINAGGNRLEASAGAVLNAAAGDDGLVVQVSEGSAVLAGAEGSRQAQAGSFIALDAAGAVRNEAAAAVFSPAPNARFLSPRDEAVRVGFSWNRINLDSEELLRIEAAADKNYTRIIHSLDSAGTSAALDFLPGTWYWRIRRENAELASGRLSVVKAAAPSPLRPAAGTVYRYRSRLPALRFQWTETDGAVQYRLEAADNPGFSGPKINAVVQGNFFESSNLGEGTWYWRVTPLFPRDYQGNLESPSASFRIERSGTLGAPVPLLPEAGGAVNIAAGRDLYFSWKKENEAESYTIRVARDESLQNPVINAVVKSNFFVYRREQKALEAGRYYWAVFQTDAEGSSSAPSPVRSFTAAAGDIILRAVFPPDNYAIAENLMPDFRFTWKSNLSQETRFQVSPSADFSSLEINEAVSGETFHGRPVAPGTWYWRIAAGATQTAARRFTAMSTLPAPSVEIPPPNGRIAVTEGEAADFSWRPVGGADYYQFRLYPGENRNPVYEQNLSGSALRVASAASLAEGTYYWTVQAFASETAAATRRTGHLSRETFFLRKIRPVRLETPEENAGIPGLEAVVVRWNTPDVLGRARFILSRSSGMGNPVLEIPNPERTLSLNRLEEGLYYWTISAETSDGFDISPAPRRFRILPVSLLPRPVLLLPVSGHVIGPEELRTNRSIVFNWDRIEGAEAYILTLYQETETGRKQIFQTGPETGLSWTLDDLRILDRGTFYWQVEAVGIGENGLTERRSLAGENSFTLDIPLPRRVQTEEAGILYGR